MFLEVSLSMLAPEVGQVGGPFLSAGSGRGWVGQSTFFQYRAVNCVCIYKTKILFIGYECLWFQASNGCLRTFLLSMRWGRMTRK